MSATLIDARPEDGWTSATIAAEGPFRYVSASWCRGPRSLSVDVEARYACRLTAPRNRHGRPDT